MELEQPLVSVGLPVYNGSNYLEAAIESVLSQSWGNLELIIYDNASTDNTESICRRALERDSRVRYYKQEKNLGAARNFNSTFEKARGKYFKWASHDDLLGPRFIEDSVTFLEENPDYVMCWPTLDHVNEDAEHLRPQGVPNLSVTHKRYSGRLRQLFDYQIAGDDIIPSIFSVIRHSALENTRLWQRFTSSEEILMLELLMQGKSHQLDQVGFYFRQHDESAFHANRTPAEREKWFDTEKHYVLQFPVWYLLARYYALISASKLSFVEKLRCHLEITRRAVFLWRRYLGDLIKYFGQFVGYRYQYRKVS